jgi:hypothetical protein
MELCQITESRIRNFIAGGRLPSIKVGTSRAARRLFKRSDLINFISYNPRFFSHLSQDKLALILQDDRLAKVVKGYEPSVNGYPMAVRRTDVDGRQTEYPSIRAAANANFVSNVGLARSIAAKREFFGGRYEYI